MYNTKYECRYCKDDIFLPSDKISEEEKDNVRDILYKEDLLMIFSIYEGHKFDEFEHVISELYKKIKDNKELMKCMTYGAAKFFSENEETGLCILYAYDYMYLTHKCVSEYLEKGIISEDNIKLLKERLLGE
jgi:hypothetical protein